ncbi:ABC transporter ATP-binding protein [Methylophilales bacterium MBRSG12]|uniref:ABC transporter ATP-binding protein n=1 Tax=Methylophilales bacterium MBRS-H7 TaxID=1623450 RepID=A0A0H4JC89_9PROT|nr:ABC transporter ATP-binding protein [Methylophilales bacterium MBRSF5]AKO66112.1 ABC transporter ATP-binding protein [Methylophilales bacterium MBRS-H7]AKO67431.1 ABC transporter ATP-binding protein [Methylophilales bacterium MBRSG12]
MATTLQASGLTRLFGPNKAVNNVSFELSKGEVLGFLGPNGAGKSTTMRMLTGNLAPTEGQVEICGINIIEEPKLAKANIGYLPEMRPLYKEFRVNEFLRIAAKLHNIPAKKINSSIDIAMEKCGLTHMSNRLIENLSNGYQQRVGIAQAIIHNPEIVILDEPTVGLDPIQIREIRKLIKEIGKEHSVILSTHILPEVEIVCDRVQIIDKGNLVFHGSIDDLKHQRRGNKLLVGFKKTPTLKKLQSLFDIVKIEKQEDLLHVIQFKNLDFDMEKFIQVCVKEKLGLFQVSPHITSLEDTFVQLTNK